MYKTMPYASFFLCAAILIHGAFGTPTPDAAGFAEILIGTLLVITVGAGSLYGLIHHISATGWVRSGQYLLIYGVSLPLLVGLTAGHNLSLVLRDIIPFLFMLMPLFFRHTLENAGQGRVRLVLTLAIAGAGFLFAARVIVPFLHYSYEKGVRALAPADPFYLANAPTVFFAALMLLGMAGIFLYRGGVSVRMVLTALGLVSLSLVPLSAMMLVEQRASAGAIILSCLILVGIGMVKKPGRMVPVFLALALAVMAGWDTLYFLASSLTEKTSIVGFNSRAQEMAAIVKSVWGSPWAVLFGKGWGATFESPAVGGIRVNFTHSLLTTYFLKTGLLGLALVGFYLVRLGLLLWPVLWRYPLIALAIGAPFAIDVFLYASFKSLDFGFLLMLIPMWAAIRQPLLQPQPTYSMQDQPQDQSK